MVGRYDRALFGSTGTSHTTPPITIRLLVQSGWSFGLLFTLLELFASFDNLARIRLASGAIPEIETKGY